MEMEQQWDAREQVFHDAVREYLIDFLFFTILYLSSYAVICRYKRRTDKEDLYSEMMHICSHCKSGFTTISAFHLHLENTHKIPLTYKCEHCAYESASLGSLKRHYIRKEKRSAAETRSCVFGEASPSFIQKKADDEDRRRQQKRSNEGETLAVRQREKMRKCPKLTVKLSPDPPVPTTRTFQNSFEQLLLDLGDGLSSFDSEDDAVDSLASTPRQPAMSTVSIAPPTPVPTVVPPTPAPTPSTSITPPRRVIIDNKNDEDEQEIMIRVTKPKCKAGTLKIKSVVIVTETFYHINGQEKRGVVETHTAHFDYEE